MIEDLLFARDWIEARARLAADAGMVTVAIVGEPPRPTAATAEAFAPALAFVQRIVAGARDADDDVFDALHGRETKLRELARADAGAQARVLRDSSSLVDALSVDVANVLVLRLLFVGERALAERVDSLRRAIGTRLTVREVIARFPAIVAEHGAPRAREIAEQVAALLPDPTSDPLAVELRRVAAIP